MRNALKFRLKACSNAEQIVVQLIILVGRTRSKCTYKLGGGGKVRFDPRYSGYHCYDEDLASLLHFIRFVWRKRCERHVLSAQRTALADMNEFQRRDLGLTRSDVLWEINERMPRV